MFSELTVMGNILVILIFCFLLKIFVTNLYKLFLNLIDFMKGKGENIWNVKEILLLKV